MLVRVSVSKAYDSFVGTFRRRGGIFLRAGARLGVSVQLWDRKTGRNFGIHGHHIACFNVSENAT